MKKKNTITRWVLKLNKTGTVDIKNREVSSYAPLNRILDEVGFYELVFFEINEDRYFATYDKKEVDVRKSMIHVGKRFDGKLLDMSDDDLINFPRMKEMFFTSKKTMIH